MCLTTYTTFMRTICVSTMLHAKRGILQSPIQDGGRPERAKDQQTPCETSLLLSARISDIERSEHFNLISNVTLSR